MRGRRKIEIYCILISFIIVATAMRPYSSEANNLSIKNVRKSSQNDSMKCAAISFDISWDNSWRNENSNYDAVWVFAKYFDYGTSRWKHVKLGGLGLNPGGFSCGEGEPLDVLLPDEDAMGCFFQRGEDGTGSISNEGAQIIWDYSEEGISGLSASEAPVKVFGIEMVYVPTDEFYVGDGDGVNESYRAFHGYVDGAIVDNVAVKITTSPVDLTYDGGGKYTVDGDGGIKYSTTVNPYWPTGYGAFYIMKYELSQSQYCGFLNTLTVEEQKNHKNGTLTEDDIGKYAMTNSSTVLYRQVVKVAGTHPFAGSSFYFGCDYAENNNNGDNIFNNTFGQQLQEIDGQCIAMHYLRWQDLCAYADWACLRPLTELEFEKAARGTGLPIFQDKPWGTTDLTKVTGSITDAGKDTESPGMTGNGICNYNFGISGALRCGFAQQDDTTRVQAGAGCFGAAELVGNINERYAALTIAAGRAFQGTHGDGVLTTASGYEGNATNVDWPGIDATPSNGVTSATGSGFRGGGFQNTEERMPLSDRYYALLTADGFTRGYGGRLGRTPPEVTPGEGTYTESETSTSTSTSSSTSTGTGTGTGTSSSSGTGTGTGTGSSSSSGTGTATSSSSSSSTSTVTESQSLTESYTDTYTNTYVW